MEGASGDFNALAGALNANQLWIQSRANPTNMKNNCVSVSTARLEAYYEVEDFWNATLGHPLQDIGLKDIQTVSLLACTGRKYIWKPYVSAGGRSAYQNLIADPPAYPAGTNFYHASSVTCGLLIYTRPDGTRHCINICWIRGYRHRDGFDVPYSVKLRDYQINDGGEANEADVQQAVHIYFIYDVQPRQTPLFSSTRVLTDLEERERMLLRRGVVPLSGPFAQDLVNGRVTLPTTSK